jgi:uncharacterized membrane protein required for colicin V production
MFLAILKQLNWVDVVVVIILIRIGYVALKNGLVLELFKFLGTILATYLSLHYYIIFSEYLGSRMGLKNIPWEFLVLLSFIILAILGYLILVVLRKIFSRLIKLEAVPKLNKWGGFILGIARAFLSISLIMFILIISGRSYLKESVKASYSGSYLFSIATSTYTSLWNGIMSKFMPVEKFNKTIPEIQKALDLKK